MIYCNVNVWPSGLSGQFDILRSWVRIPLGQTFCIFFTNNMQFRKVKVVLLTWFVVVKNDEIWCLYLDKISAMDVQKRKFQHIFWLIRFQRIRLNTLCCYLLNFVYFWSYLHDCITVGYRPKCIVHEMYFVAF